MSNVIQFPPDRIKNPERIGKELLTKEEIDSNRKSMQHLHIDETVEFIIPILFNQLNAAGFNVADEDIKSGAFILEAIRSVLCGIYGIEHPFHEIADKVFVEEKQGHLRVADSLHIEFNKNAVANN